jgi:hypothetical protein
VPVSYLETTGEGRMAESCGWVFVDNVPLIYEKERVAKQLQVETWLSLSQIVKELQIEDTQHTKKGTSLTRGYVV